MVQNTRRELKDLFFWLKVFLFFGLGFQFRFQFVFGFGFGLPISRTVWPKA